MVLRIIFNTSIENYLFIVLIIIFRGITNLFLGLQCFESLAVEADWFESLTSLGDHFENFKVEECFQRECQGETFSGRKSCVVMTKIHNGSIISAALAKKVTCDIRCHFCCGATVGSEQQHNQDLREIYKGRGILEFITFYHNALHLTRVHCATNNSNKNTVKFASFAA